MMTLDEALALLSSETNTKADVETLVLRYKGITDEIQVSPRAFGMAGELMKESLLEFLIDPRIVIVQAMAGGLLLGLLMSYEEIPCGIANPTTEH